MLYHHSIEPLLPCGRIDYSPIIKSCHEVTGWSIPVAVGIVSLVLALSLPRAQIEWSGWIYFSMLRYLIRRLLLTIPVLLGVATLVFALIHFIPGDPAQAILGEGATQEEVAQLRARLGLDRPLLVQYATFLRGAAHAICAAYAAMSMAVSPSLLRPEPRG